MEVGAFVKEHLFTNRAGEDVDRYGVVIANPEHFKGFVEVVWQPRAGHPIAADAHTELTAIEKLEVIVPPTKENAAR